MVLAVLAPVAHSLSSTLAAVDGYVSPVDDVAMYAYVPDTTPTDTQAIIVAIHSCERSAEYYFENTDYAALADQYGYIVVYPNVSTPSGCWDVSDCSYSPASSYSAFSSTAANLHLKKRC